jgi:hypothetical protein
MDGISKGGLHLSGVLIAALFLAAWLLEEDPLVVDRPAPGDFPKSLAGQGQDVPARLWEDPVEAVMKHREQLVARAEATGAPRYDGRRTPVATPETSVSQTAEAGTWDPARRCTGAPREDAEHDAAWLLRRSLERARQRAGAAPIDIDLVFLSISAAHWAEAQEGRLRARYAFLSSLFEQGYAPLEDEHIGYWCVPQRAGPDDAGETDAGTAAGRKLLMPFEAFLLPAPAGDAGRSGTGPAKGRLALLMWVPEGELQQNPLRELDALAGALVATGPDAGPGGDGDDAHPEPGAATEKAGNPFSRDAPAVTLTWVGPRGSGTLARVFAELCERQRGEATAFATFSSERPLRIISPTATGASRTLLPQGCGLGLVDAAGRVERYTDLREAVGVELLRSIVTDDELMRLAVQELRLRNVDPFPRVHPCETCRRDGRGDYVVLISELDTAYGRALPEAFLGALWTEGGRAAGSAHGAGVVANVLQYGYMRGLDGVVGEAVAAADRGGGAANLSALTEHVTERYIEPPVGASQFDYLRRLANKLRDKDAQLRREGRGGIRAFGVLGSDYYDKLLILQALREHFPDHHYVITDLDARLLDPDDFSAVRNLVVVSSFDLSLAEAWQQRVPPFRNQYQASVFLAGKLIGGARLAGVAELLEAQVFEVGHGRFYRLRTLADTGSAPGGAIEGPLSVAQCLEKGTACPPLNAPPWTFPGLFGGRWIETSVAAAIVLFLAFAVVPGAWSWARGQWSAVKARAREARTADDRKALRYLHTVPGWLWFVVAAGLLLGSMYLAMRATLEPFALASGISIWPAELTRTVAGLVAAVMIYRAWMVLKESDEALETDFELVEPKPAAARPPDAAARSAPPVASGTGFAGQIAAFQQWVNEGRPLSRRDELEIETRRLKESLRPTNGDTQSNSDADTVSSGRDFRPVWKCYRQYADFGARARQALLVSVPLLLLASLMTVNMHPQRVHTLRAAWPGAEAPNGRAELLDQLVRWWPELNGIVLLAIPFALLTVAILHEVLICNRLVKEVRDVSLDKGVWLSFLGDHSSTRQNYVLTIFFIARRTEATSDVVWYPLVVWGLVILSLNTRFDNFEPTAGILFMLLLALALSLAPLFMLRRAAQWVRNSILEALKNDVFLTRRKQAATPGEESQVIIDRIKEMQIGAFRPWYREPVVQVLFWLLSFGALVITEYLRTGG